MVMSDFSISNMDVCHSRVFQCHFLGKSGFPIIFFIQPEKNLQLCNKVEALIGLKIQTPTMQAICRKFYSNRLDPFLALV